MWGNISIAFLLALIATFMVTPYSIKIAKKIGAVDIPKDDRRMRIKAMPKLGGIAVVAGFAISFFYLISVMHIEGSIDLFDQNMYLKKIIGIGIGTLIILITGISNSYMDSWNNKCNKFNRWIRWIIIWNCINILCFFTNNFCTKLFTNDCNSYDNIFNRCISWVFTI